MAKVVSLDAVKSGLVTLVDLQKANAMLDMQSDISDQAMDDAREESKNKKGGGGHSR